MPTYMSRAVQNMERDNENPVLRELGTRMGSRERQDVV